MLRFTRTAGSPGYATFLLTVSDPLGILSSSEPYLVSVVGTLLVDADTSGNNDGSGWTNAFTHLQDALTIAAQMDGFEVWVAEGTYFPDEGKEQANNDRNSTFMLTNNIAIYGGFRGNELLHSERNATDAPTILSGDLNQDDFTGGDNSENAFNVMRATGQANLILDGFTITADNGFTNDDDQPFASDGGGLHIQDSAALSLNHCIFQGNSGISGGGFANFLNSNASVHNCIFRGNFAFRGGGCFNNGSSHPIATRPQRQPTHLLLPQQRRRRLPRIPKIHRPPPRLLDRADSRSRLHPE